MAERKDFKAVDSRGLGAMTTDNRTNEPTPEQVEAAMFQLFPITVRYDGCDVPNPGAADKREGFKAGIEYMRGLLSEGADPSRQEIPLVCLGFESGSTFAVTGENAGHWVEGSPTHVSIAEGARTALAAAGVAPQEPSRLPDFFAPKPMPNSYVPAPVLPSSGVDEKTLLESLTWHSTRVS